MYHPSLDSLLLNPSYVLSASPNPPMCHRNGKNQNVGNFHPALSNQGLWARRPGKNGNRPSAESREQMAEEWKCPHRTFSRRLLSPCYLFSCQRNLKLLINMAKHWHSKLQFARFMLSYPPNTSIFLPRPLTPLHSARSSPGPQPGLAWPHPALAWPLPILILSNPASSFRHCQCQNGQKKTCTKVTKHWTKINQNSTPNMTGRRLHRTMEMIPTVPW